MRKLYVTVNMQEFNDGDNVFGSQLFELKNVENAGYDEIFVHDTLDFLTYNDRMQTLNLLISKLRHGGKMTILGSDIKLITMGYHIGGISEEKLNELMMTNRMSTSSNTKTVEVCEKHGLKVLRNRIYDYKWQVTVERI